MYLGAMQCLFVCECEGDLGLFGQGIWFSSDSDDPPLVGAAPSTPPLGAMSLPRLSTSASQDLSNVAPVSS